MRSPTSPRVKAKRRTRAASAARSTTARDTRPAPEALRTNLYDEVTARIVGELEAGRVPWVRCLRHPGLAGVVGEVAKYSTTASKRLQLAAEASGVTAFVFRRASRLEAGTEGTAAMTRWRITAAPSEDLGIPSLARPRWRVELERVRGGNPHAWIVEGCDASGRIALPAALVDRPAAQEDRQAAA